MTDGVRRALPTPKDAVIGLSVHVAAAPGGRLEAQRDGVMLISLNCARPVG